MSKRLLACALAASAVMLAACDDDDNAQMVISNRSDFALVEVHIAQINDPTWGPNLLPGVLAPGQDLVIVDINCDTYDVLVVDEFGVNCELLNNRLCFDSDVWVIDNLVLDVCAFSARTRQEETSPQVSEPAATADPAI